MATIFPILLVDDDPGIADVMIHAAKSSFPEAAFTHVSNFEQAKSYIEEMEGKCPKLVLLDIDLQDRVDGLDFLALMRAHPKGRILPVVVLSANNAPQLVEQAYSLGASSFTMKPFSLASWKVYLSTLKIYWYETVTLLDIRHYKM